MTIAEAEQRWKLCKATILGYLADGLIDPISIADNQIILPDIPKPKKIKSNSKRNSANIYRWILEACFKNEYISASLIGISTDTFDNHLQQLVREQYLIIHDNSHHNSSNISCQITQKGINELKTKKTNVGIPFPIEINLIKIL